MIQLARFVKSSAVAWAVAAAAILTCVAIAKHKPLSNAVPPPTAVEVFKLGHSPADRMAAIRQHSKFHQGFLTPRNSRFLAHGELTAKFKHAGVTAGGSGSITLTASHPCQTSLGAAAPAASLVIAAPTLAFLDDTGWIEIPSPEVAGQPTALTVMFAPTSAQKPYMIEVDLNAVGPATALVVNQPGGLSATVPIEGNGHTAQFLIVPADTRWINLNIWPNHGEIGINAIKISGF